MKCSLLEPSITQLGTPAFWFKNFVGLTSTSRYKKVSWSMYQRADFLDCSKIQSNGYEMNNLLDFLESPMDMKIPCCIQVQSLRLTNLLQVLISSGLPKLKSPIYKEPILYSFETRFSLLHLRKVHMLESMRSITLTAYKRVLKSIHL